MTWLKVLDLDNKGKPVLLNTNHVVRVEYLNDVVSKLILSDGHSVSTEAGLASVELALLGPNHQPAVGRPKS